MTSLTVQSEQMLYVVIVHCDKVMDAAVLLNSAMTGVVQ